MCEIKTDWLSRSIPAGLLLQMPSLTQLWPDTLLNVFLAIAVDNLANAQELTKVIKSCWSHLILFLYKYLFILLQKSVKSLHSLSLIFLILFNYLSIPELQLPFTLPICSGWRGSWGSIQPEACSSESQGGRTIVLLHVFRVSATPLRAWPPLSPPSVSPLLYLTPSFF